MLARLGIQSTIYQNRKASGYKPMPDGKGGKKEYFCQTLHELSISNNNIILFYEIIGSDDVLYKLR